MYGSPLPRDDKIHVLHTHLRRYNRFNLDTYEKIKNLFKFLRFMIGRAFFLFYYIKQNREGYFNHIIQCDQVADRTVPDRSFSHFDSDFSYGQTHGFCDNNGFWFWKIMRIIISENLNGLTIIGPKSGC